MNLAHAEPAAVTDSQTEGAVQCSRGGVVRYALEVGFGRSPAFALSEQCGADAAGDSLPPHVLADKYRVDAYELAVEDPQSCRCDSSVRVADEHSNLILGDRVIHAGNNAQMDGVRHLLEGEKASEPLAVDPVFYLDRQGGSAFRIACEQRTVHDIDPMLYVVASGGECSVEGRVGQRADLEYAGRSPPLIDFFAVRYFFFQRKDGGSDRFRAVRPVRIEIGKAEDPAVVYLHLVGRPCVK